jgi:two-component system NarL family response regulator
MTEFQKADNVIVINLKMQTPIRIMLVDDHPAFLKGVAALIESESDLKVVSQAGNGHEAVETYRQTRPDVVLMDLRLPGIGGVEAIMAIRKEYSDARVIVLTTFDTDEDIYRAIESGAKAYLLKDVRHSELSKTIRDVHAGRQVIPAKLAERLAVRRRRSNLSEREMEVLQLLIKGRSNKEIAASLFVGEDAVKGQLKSLFVKLGVHDRTEAAICAVRYGIVHLE